MRNGKSRTFYRMRAAIGLALGYPSRLGTHISLTALPLFSTIDPTAALDSRVRFYRSSLGRYSYVGRGSFVESTCIGAFCSIASDCFIGGAGHPLDYPSSSPVFCDGGNILGVGFASIPFEAHQITRIENDVWIGQGAKIRSGVTIANGAVIGMGSVLTKDVGPYEIWAGNPARYIRRRFSGEAIKELLATQWWEWDEGRLHEERRFFERAVEG